MAGYFCNAAINNVIALILNMLWVYFVVSMTGRVERFLGKGGIYIIRKFFGIILLAISVRLFTANITILILAYSARNESSVVNAPAPANNGNTKGTSVASFIGP